MTARQFAFVASRVIALVLVVFGIQAAVDFLIGIVPMLSASRAYGPPSRNAAAWFGLAAWLARPIVLLAIAHVFWHKADRISGSMTGEVGDEPLLTPTAGVVVRGALIVLGACLLAKGLTGVASAVGSWMQQPPSFDTVIDPNYLAPWLLGPLVNVGLGIWMILAPGSLVRWSAARAAGRDATAGAS